MSGYQSAPATARLATRCCICARPLLDAVSVERGIGPECRKKHLRGTHQLPEAIRAEGNRIIAQAALDAEDFDVPAIINHATRLRELGFATVADKMMARFIDISIEDKDGKLHVRHPFMLSANPDWGRLFPGSWRQEIKARVVVNDTPNKRRLMWLLATHFPGKWAMGPKGPFKLVLKEQAP